jgi:hypothetical protein
VNEQKVQSDQEELRCKTLIDTLTTTLNGLNPIPIDNTAEIARLKVSGGVVGGGGGWWVVDLDGSGWHCVVLVLVNYFFLFINRWDTVLSDVFLVGNVFFFPCSFFLFFFVLLHQEQIQATQTKKQAAGDLDTDEGDLEEARCKGVVRKLKKTLEGLNPVPVNNTREIQRLKTEIIGVEKEKEKARWKGTKSVDPAMHARAIECLGYVHHNHTCGVATVLLCVLLCGGGYFLAIFF